MGSSRDETPSTRATNTLWPLKGGERGRSPGAPRGCCIKVWKVLRVSAGPVISTAAWDIFVQPSISGKGMLFQSLKGMGGQSRANTTGLSREVERAGFTRPEIMVANMAVARLISVVRSQRHDGSGRSLRRREISGLGVVGPIKWHVGRGAPHSATLAFQRVLGSPDGGIAEEGGGELCSGRL